MLSSSNKVLGFRDVAMMTVLANFGLRWLAVAASLGASAVIFWFLAALIFFLPVAIMTANLSVRYPEEGGIYAWVRHVLGERQGFIVAWLYWVTNIFYYPAVLIFLATNFSYFLGRPELAQNHVYIVCVVLITYWAIALISFLGLRANKMVTEYGGIIGTFIPALLLIMLALASLGYFKQSATPYTWHTLIPSGRIFDNLSTLSIIMFAMAGIEIIPTFANSVENPRRNLYFGLLVGALGIFCLYTIGTVAINIILPPGQISETSGIMATFAMIALKFHMPWLVNVMGFLLSFAEVAAVSVWLIAPIIIFFKCTPLGLLPKWTHQTNRYGAPTHAIIFMGIVITLIVVTTNFIGNVRNMYQILVLMSTILYFIPYLFLAIVYWKVAPTITERVWLHRLCVMGVMVSVSLGILFSFEPPTGMSWHHAFYYELELILGPLIFLILGFVIYQYRYPFIQK